jgi:hypothetical protein
LPQTAPLSGLVLGEERQSLKINSEPHSGHREKMMHPNQTKYNKASQDRKREAGLVRVERWVHKTRKAELDAVIAELQKPAKNANQDH